MDLRKATPDPVTLLTHEDRMSQLDMESRGENTWTPSRLIPENTARPNCDYFFRLHMKYAYNVRIKTQKIKL